jgi:hypothetical protein
LLSGSELERAVALLERGDWQAAHTIVQQDEATAFSCWAHGIAHLMEGDVSNARYWYRAAARDFPEAPSVAAEISALKSSIGMGRAKK